MYRTQDEFAAHFMRLFSVDPFEICPRNFLTHRRTADSNRIANLNTVIFKLFNATTQCQATLVETLNAD